jgi:hypothetical protein
LNGLAIAAHVDREVFSIIGQLGFIPEDLPLDAVEISSRTGISRALEQFPGIEKFPLITSSDSHLLEDIGGVSSSFLLEAPCIDEIRLAFKKEKGRMVMEV